MKVAIYGRCPHDDAFQDLFVLMTKFSEYKAELFISDQFLSYLQDKDLILGNTITSFSSLSDLDKNIDYLLSIGGDGTFLDASYFAVELDVPILGINFGRLGFLTQVSSKSINKAIEEVFAEEYEIETRSMIQAFGQDQKYPRALNEVCIQRSNPGMIQTTVWVDDDLMASYWSDGLLVATPTGSTAYSLSAGGPILLPGTHNFIITPIAPHNLNIRPIILSDNSKIEVEVITRQGHSTLSMDNKMFSLKSGARIKVVKSDFNLKFIKLKDYSFYKTLRNKLNWGTDLRN